MAEWSVLVIPMSILAAGAAGEKPGKWRELAE
jgi:hypothetical protein